MKKIKIGFLSLVFISSFSSCSLFDTSSGRTSYSGSNDENLNGNNASSSQPIGCQQTNSGGSTCGLGYYCDVASGQCVVQPCVGDNQCPANQTEQDGSVIGYQCNTSGYINSCEQYVVSGPTNVITCPTGQACTLPNGAGTNSGICANNTCTCTTPTQCASGYFCKIATKTCVAYTPNECTNTANLASDNCNALYYSLSTFQFYCDPNAPTRCRRLIETSCSTPGCNACKKHRWCQTGWCYYSQNADPTAEPPDPNNLTEMGSCRAKENDSSLGLNVGEKCTISSQCTGSIGLTCLAGECSGVLGSACTSTIPASNADCSGGIWKGHQGAIGCANNSTYCMSGLSCQNLTKVATPGYYCVGGRGATCTTEAGPSSVYAVYPPNSLATWEPTGQGASTECFNGICESGTCGIKQNDPCLPTAGGAWCKSSAGCLKNTGRYGYGWCNSYFCR